MIAGGGSGSDALARAGTYNCTQCWDTGMLGAMSGHGTIWCSCAKGRMGHQQELDAATARAAWLAVQRAKNS